MYLSAIWFGMAYLQVKEQTKGAKPDINQNEIHGYVEGLVG